MARKKFVFNLSRVNSTEISGFLKVENGKVTIEPIEEQWQSLLTQYGLLIVLILALVVFAAFMPLCGFCFCCCRCCGNCGARSKPFDNKCDLCRKIYLATMLIGIGTLLS